MGKAEFLAELRKCLAQLPPEEVNRQVAYYDELLSDMMEDGMSEEAATAQLGAPTAVAQALMEEMPLHTLVTSRVKPKSGWTALSVTLIVLGFPLWFPLLIAFGSVALAVLIVLWTLEFAFAAVVLALGVTALALPIGLITGAIHGAPLTVIGGAMLAGGVFLLGTQLVVPLWKGIVKCCTGFFRSVKSLFIKRRTEE